MFIIRKKSFLSALAIVIIMAFATGEAATTIHDVAADWSDAQNPNGVWTYTGNNGAVLTTNQVDWDPGRILFSAQQRAWANATLPAPGHVPMWFRNSGPSVLDVPGVGMHGSEGFTNAWVGVVWRSPVSGHVNISGGVWQAFKGMDSLGGNHSNRNSVWRLTHNGTVLASGNISGMDGFSSASPFSFAMGAGGIPLSNIVVNAGDEIVLEFISPTSFATFNGIELVIEATENVPAAVEYQYVGNPFNIFSCGVSSLCSTVDPSFTSYDATDFVRVSMVFDQLLPSNLVLQDVRSLPGFGLTINDGHQELTFANEVMVSTDGDGNITAPWSVISNGPSVPNNGVATLNWPGGRGVADIGTLSAPTGSFPDTPLDMAQATIMPGTWTRVSADIVYSNLGPGNTWSNSNGWTSAALCIPADCPLSPGSQSLAFSFVSSGDFWLTSIELAVSDIADLQNQRPGQTPFDVGIYSNSSIGGLDQPGALLGSATTTAPENRSCNPGSDPNCLPNLFITPLQTLTSVSMASPISLAAGERYWIGHHPNNPQDRVDIAWWWNHLVDGVQSRRWSTGGGGAINFSSVALGGTWDSTLVQAEPAFRVKGVPIVNAPPTADAGANQSIHAGQLVTLDGSGSNDDLTSTASLLYSWSLSVPPGSVATLSGAMTISPSFIADLPGEYVGSLVVTDEGGLSSTPATVTVSSLNTPPTAGAGLDQGAVAGGIVSLDGSSSNDADLDVIAYAWALTGRPAGSTAVLAGANSVSPSFVPDLPGIYVAQLIVNDGLTNSTPDQVTISVVMPDSVAGVSAIQAINAVAALPPGSFRKTGDQRSFSTRISQVIIELQKGSDKMMKLLQEGDVVKADAEMAKAIDKATKRLTRSIERTDGCALRGSPDTGGGPKKDDIVDCASQSLVYPLLIAALGALTTP